MKNFIFIIVCLLTTKLSGQNLIVEYLAENKSAEQHYSLYLIDGAEGTYDINIFHAKYPDYSDLLKDDAFLKSRIYINSLKKEGEAIYGVRYHNKGRKVYKDTPPPIGWKTSNEVKTILGFQCKKATAEFRGRNYTAWYTEDIAVSQGPWKLRGLPGLILAAKTDDGIFSFEAVNIKLSSPLSVPEKFKTIYASTDVISYQEQILDEKIKLQEIVAQQIASLPKDYVPVSDSSPSRNGEMETSFEWEKN
ncbi:GLPGLI family protein [Bergeyella sp. RCAD1439]|uniref:GLPGLI family protein n=1 Tax=Bergeyella anatis TaxID=3113737 RepID=UPI002E182829|nr:GLPGLI family protein [Bergeyella sp. RCAD1439]